MTRRQVVTRARVVYAGGVKPALSLWGVRVNNDGVWVKRDEEEGCCGLGAAAIGLKFIGPSTDFVTGIAKTLGISYEQCRAFVEGFDGYEGRYAEPQWWRAGRALAKELFGGEHDGES